jgi:hypothetical protein
MAITRRLLLFFLVSSLALSALFAVAQSVIATVTAGTTPVAVAVFLSTLPTLRPGLREVSLPLSRVASILEKGGEL